MTFTDFVSKWNGKYVDFDGVYGNQCMDLMHQYCVEVLGISDGSVLAAPSARDVYINFPNVPGAALFEQIDNTPTGVPQEGDIVFWTNTPYGHVAIFHDGDVNSFMSFDQNWPTGSPCHIQNHTSYANVGGWLRFKGSQSIQGQLDQCRMDRDGNWNIVLAVANTLGVQANKDLIIAEIKKLVGYEDLVVKQDAQIQDLQAQLTSVKNDLAIKTQDDLKAQQDLNTAQGQIDELQKKYADSQTANTDLSNRIAELEKAIVAPVRKGWKAFLVSLVDKL